MKAMTFPPRIRPVNQRGATLITGLIFLVVLTLIGVTAARMSSLEERMAGNLRDRSLAMQAAELALRDAERDILGQGNRSPAISGITGFAPLCGAATAGVVNDNGLCYNGVAGYSPPLWSNVANMTNVERSVGYGQFSGAAGIPGLSAQPRYIIEGMQKYCWRQCEATLTPGYRITVRAQGINPNTVVWLQEIFKP